MMWCPVYKTNTIGPCVFDNRLCARRHTSQCSAILKCTALTSCLARRALNRIALSHNSGTVIDYPENKIGDRWISSGNTISWSAISPDVTPLEFFSGYLKDSVYLGTMQSVENLKSRITKSVRSFEADTLSNV